MQSEPNTWPPRSPLWPDSECELDKQIDCSSIVAAWRAMGLDLDADLAGIEAIGLWRCRSSQLQFYSPAPIGSERLYAFIARQRWYYAQCKWEFTKAVELLKACGCDTILEVGCGTGAFLHSAQSMGLTAKGIDLNAVAVQQAQDAGLTATTDSLAAVAERGQRFSAVCAFQVLEHVGNPRDFIGQALSLVKPGGILLFCTPDGDGWLGRRLQLLDMPPHHVTRWGRAAFAFLPRIFPVELVSLIPEPLAPQHYSAWAAAMIDPDQGGGESAVRYPRPLSFRNRIIVAGMRRLRQAVQGKAQGDGQSLMAIYRRV